LPVIVSLILVTHYSLLIYGSDRCNTLQTDPVSNHIIFILAK